MNGNLNDHVLRGNLRLLVCGDVESNPGPVAPLTTPPSDEPPAKKLVRIFERNFTVERVVTKYHDSRLNTRF